MLTKNLKKIRLLFPLTAGLSMVAVQNCAEFSKSTSDTETSSAELSEQQYNDLVAKYNDNVNKYNDLVKNNIESDKIIIEYTKFLDELDTAALKVRGKANVIRATLNANALGNGGYATQKQVRDEMRDLETRTNEALAALTKLEKLTSQKGTAHLKASVDHTIINGWKDFEKSTREFQVSAAGNLSGIRDLIIAQQNDIVELANKVMMALPAGTTARDINPAREGNMIPDNVSPIVQNPAEGGVIMGVARNSTTGQPVGGAFVGFKKRVESNAYFYETTTQRDGTYESPSILPGTYFIDVKKEGMVHVQNQPVTVVRNQRRSETFSMTEPLADGVYRITMSWTQEKAGAVKDVDSYLQIPGNVQPLSYKTLGIDFAGTHLDRDDTDWAGPETVTIRNLRSGEYVYYVNNYNRPNDNLALGVSEVRVKVYKGQALIKSYSVPAGVGITYEVFRIRNGVIIDSEAYNDSLSVHR